GTILPLVLVGAVPPGGRGTGAAVGRIYAVNTVGAIVGSLLTGFVLIPTLGTQVTLLGATGVLAATGLVFALTPPRLAWLPAAAALGAVGIVLGVVLRPAWNYQDLQTSVAEPGRLPSGAIHQLTDPRERILYAREGPTASVLASQ